MDRKGAKTTAKTKKARISMPLVDNSSELFAALFVIDIFLKNKLWKQVSDEINLPHCLF
jgi:hypothetical protein